MKYNPQHTFHLDPNQLALYPPSYELAIRIVQIGAQKYGNDPNNPPAPWVSSSNPSAPYLGAITCCPSDYTLSYQGGTSFDFTMFCP